MTPPPFDEAQLLRAEIAAAAARLIAQDGADYLSAKRKAARQVLGEAQANEQLLPDNAQIENEVRLYHTLFKADTHLQLFADSAKEVEIYLLNQNLNLDISETPHFKGPRFEPVETVSFLWRQEGVHAALYEMHDLRGALKARDGKPLRADLAALRALLVSSTHE